MTKPTAKEADPPAWKGEVEQIIREKYPDELPYAATLISHPKVSEAKKKLDTAWRGRKNVRKPYPASLFAEAIYTCAFYAVPRAPIKLPFWMTDKREATRLAKNSRELMKVVEAFVKSVGGPDNGPIVWQKETENGKEKTIEFVPDLVPLADAHGVVASKKILAAVRFLADELKMIAEMQRDEGRPENLSVRNLLCGLEDRFRADFGKPLHHVIALLWGSASGRNKTTENVKSTLIRYRKG